MKTKPQQESWRDRLENFAKECDTMSVYDEQRVMDIISSERQRVIEEVREIVSTVDNVRYYPSIGIDKVEWIKKSELLQELTKLEKEL